MNVRERLITAAISDYSKVKIFAKELISTPSIGNSEIQYTLGEALQAHFNSHAPEDRNFEIVNYLSTQIDNFERTMKTSVLYHGGEPVLWLTEYFKLTIDGIRHDDTHRDKAHAAIEVRRVNKQRASNRQRATVNRCRNPHHR
jgi:hypothetical protein